MAVIDGFFAQNGLGPRETTLLRTRGVVIFGMKRIARQPRPPFPWDSIRWKPFTHLMKIKSSGATTSSFFGGFFTYHDVK
jgi:hypothetical protein